jgi:hypothetical protein
MPPEAQGAEKLLTPHAPGAKIRNEAMQPRNTGESVMGGLAVLENYTAAQQ